MSAPPSSGGESSEQGERLFLPADIPIPIEIEEEKVPDTMPQTGEIRALLLGLRQLIATTHNETATQIHRFEAKVVDMICDTNMRVSRLEVRVVDLEQASQGWVRSSPVGVAHSPRDSRVDTIYQTEHSPRLHSDFGKLKRQVSETGLEQAATIAGTIHHVDHLSGQVQKLTKIVECGQEATLKGQDKTQKGIAEIRVNPYLNALFMAVWILYNLLSPHH